MPQKIVTILLGLIVVAALAWYINKTYVQPTSSESQSKTDDGQLNIGADIEKLNSDLYFVTKQAATDIWKRDTSGKTKKAFTDADETSKISKLSNVASQTGEVLAVTGVEGSQKLVVINLFDTKQKIIKDLFPNPYNLAISTDGKYISYTKFSNLEENYGYTLYAEEKTGGKIKEIAHSSSEIVNPAWCSGSALAYGTTSGTKTSIKSFDISAGSEKNMVDLDGKIVDWLSCQGSQIIVSVRDLGKNDQGVIAKVTVNGLSNVLDFSNGKAAYVYQNGSDLAYILAQYKNKIDAATSGQIYIYNSDTSKKSAIQKGIQILGWAAAK